MKKIVVINGVPYFLGYGIESGGLRHKVPITDDEKMECLAMKFEHGISDLTIGKGNVIYEVILGKEVKSSHRK